MSNFLTILIPTYNRKEKLARTIEQLKNQTCKEFQVIISDNCSDYNVFELIDEIGGELKNRIYVIRNQFNIGVDSNVVNLFLNVQTKWIWPMSDDDFLRINAVEQIKKDTEIYPQAAWIDYPVYPDGTLESNIVFNRLDEYIDFSLKIMPKQSVWGNLVYLANKVYHFEKIKSIIPLMFQFNYTKIATSILILKSLDIGEQGIVINNKIVDYNSDDGVRWNVQSVCLGIRTYVDISFNLSKKDMKKLYKLIAPSSYLLKLLLKQYLPVNKTIEYPGMGIDLIYSDIYKKYVPFYIKPLFWMLNIVTTSPFLYRLFRKMCILAGKINE